MSQPDLAVSPSAQINSDSAVSELTKWRVLLGAIIVQLILGTVYGYSIFWQPLQAEVFPPVLTQAQVDAGASAAGAMVVADADAVIEVRAQQQGYLKYAFAICILSFAVVMVIAGRVQDLMGPRFTAAVGGTMMGVGFLIAGLMTNTIVFYLAHAAFVGALVIVLLMIYHAMLGGLDKQQLPVLQYIPLGIVAASVVAGVVLAQQYVGRQGEMDKLFLLWGTVGFLSGAGIGFAYVCPIAALIKWFPKQKGLMAGIAVAGFGFGAYIFSSKDLPFSAENFIKQHGVVQLFMIHGVVSLVALLIGAMMLSNPPGTPAKAATDSNWQDTLKRPAFYVLWLMYFSGALAGLMVIGILKPFAGEQLVSAAREGGAVVSADKVKQLMAAGVTAVGWLAIFNAVGRIFWGFASDMVGRTGAFIANFLIQAVVMFTLAGMDTEVSLAVVASLVGFNYGGCFALFPSATADLFGSKNLGANYGWVFTSYGIAGVVGIALGNFAKEQYHSYTAAFNIAAVLCVLSAGLAVVLMVLSNRQKAAAATSG